MKNRLVLNGVFLSAILFITFFTMNLAYAAVSTNLEIHTYKKGQKYSVNRGKYIAQEHWTKIEYQTEKNPSFKEEKQKKTRKSKSVEKKPSKSEATQKSKKPVFKKNKVTPKKAFVVDQNSDKAIFFFDKPKKFMEVEFNQMGMWQNNNWLKVFRLGGFQVKRESFEKMGFKAIIVRQENIENHPCDVWSIISLPNNRKLLKATVWVAKEDSLQKIPLKMKIEESNGRLTEVKLSNPQQIKVGADFFSPPKGYEQHQPQIVSDSGKIKEIEQKSNMGGVKKRK